jgi:tRNA A-37 threonylcarbamoyl transferase component Bud32
VHEINRDSVDTDFELPAAVIATLQRSGWQIDTRPPWVHVRRAAPAEHIVQGWKLHVSATIASAPRVLANCASVLVDAGCEFKFARSTHALRELNDTRAPRGMSGKFLTAYPRNEEQLRILATQLDEATHGLDGPRILSDARLRPDSLVHYRYGAFYGVQVLDNDGSYSNRILTPDGALIPDRREAFFSPPSWATPPFPSAGEAVGRVDSVLLNDRYCVSTAIRHANKGGVYVAEDTRTGSTVIIKEGRPHVATDRHGRDARAVIRHEAEALRRLEGLGVTPRFVELFIAEDHAFLVEEKSSGVSLERWVALQRDQGRPLPYEAWWTLAEKLTHLIGEVHGRGVILRDFNPNNVLLDQDRLLLIDLELAQLDQGAPTVYEFGGTPGFSAPEQFRGEPPAPSVDLFSLGAILFFLATAASPEMPMDSAGSRTFDELVALRLGRPRLACPPPVQAVDLIRALMSEKPVRRPTLAQVSSLLKARRPDAKRGRVDLWRGPSSKAAYSSTRVLARDQWDELVDGILAHLEATVDLSPGSARLWPSTAYGNETEPCAVQYGAGGVLAVLARLYRHRRTGCVERLLTAVCDWLQRHVRNVEHNLPGLFFGASGTALALYDAGVVLERADCVDLATAVLRRLPTRWPNPDITHGAAGVGTALLLLWQATGVSDLAGLVAEVADAIVAARREEGSQILWTVPVDFDSRLAGYSSYGFAHGTAGIGSFLLAAGRALGRDDLVVIARRCGQTLIELAEQVDGTAIWHEGPGKPGLLTHWCNGASGVGTLFVRLYAADADVTYRDLSESAARAVMQRRWTSGTAYCHGLAGDGDFLLDLAEVTGSTVHRNWAEEIASTLYDRRVYRDRRAVTPNETGMEVTAEFGTGLAGHLAFLIRLRYGGPRMFHPPLTFDAVTRPS